MPYEAAFEEPYAILLKSRSFVPPTDISPAALDALEQPVKEAEAEARHILLQLYYVPSDAEREALRNTGISLLEYIPNNAWVAIVTGSPSKTVSQAADEQPGLIRWAGVFALTDKTNPVIHADLESSDTEAMNYSVKFFEDVSSDLARQILGAVGAEITEEIADFSRYEIALPRARLSELAGYDSVQWVQPGTPPKEELNDGVRSRTNVDTVHSAPYSLSGSGVDLGEWDGGKIYSHTDFSGRLTVVDSGASTSSHATHVGGTMAGDGARSASQGGSANQWMGTAPGADIFSYYWDNNLTDHNGAINTYGIELSQNSWGYTVDEAAYNNCYLYGDYSTDADDYDDIITGRYGDTINVVFAAGNERNDGDCGMSSTSPYLNYAVLGPPGTGKNIITVGATNSNDDSMTSFSSWGPVDDGRLKPDIVAPGCQSNGDYAVTSASTSNGYTTMCGTSMAAPATSGIVALLIEQWRALHSNQDPLPSTVKALLIHGAFDLDDGTSYYNPGPDYASGYGRVDAQASADLIRNDQVHEENSISHGETKTFYFNVAPGDTIAKVTLVWDDEPGSVFANPALVNNLDLWLVAPDGSTIHRPWILDPNNPANNATTGTDSLNNVEQVYVSNPTAGQWRVVLQGTNIPQGPQSFSLIASRQLSTPDLTTNKTNNIGGRTTSGYSYSWTITISNTSSTNAVFANGQTIFSDNLPDSNMSYGAVSVTNVTNVTNSGNISCAIASNNLICTASGAAVMIGSSTGSFDVQFNATASTAGSFPNPRGSGICRVDPATAISESNESNNECSDTVTVIGCQATFGDVPCDHQHWRYIEVLYDEGYTAGCSTSPLNYCPDTILNRGMTAVFILRGAEGVGVNPPNPNPDPVFCLECVPSCVGCDPCPACDWDFYCDPGTADEMHILWAKRWSEHLYDEGYTAGCQAPGEQMKYCPCQKLPKVEASVFALRLMHGQSYQPPPATGTLFADMTDTGYWGTKWAEQAYRWGLLPDCGVEGGKPKFCPDEEVNRAWAAYMVVQAKDLNVPYTLTQPTLVSPADGSTPAGSQPTLTWDAIAGATWYNVQVADTGKLGQPDYMKENEWVQATDACSGSQCSWQVDDALANGGYDWRVRGRDTQAHLSPWSSVWDFNISP